jgi:ligand-binding sensor domain-containing protein
MVVGLCRLKNGRWTTYTTKNGLANNRIFSLFMAKDTTLWIGTRGGGISLLKNGSFTTYSTSNGLTNNEIRNILEASNGLNRLKDGKLTNYTTKEGRPLHGIFYTTRHVRQHSISDYRRQSKELLVDM